MGDEHHRYYKHTKFHQNPRDDPKFLVDLTRNDTYIVYVHCHTYFDNMATTDVPYSPTKLYYKNIYKFKCRGKMEFYLQSCYYSVVLMWFTGAV